MDHVGSYFSKTVEKVIKHKFEKDIFCETVLKLTGIEINPKDFSVKNGIAKIKVFGPKRTKILSMKESILKELKEKSIILTRLE